MNPLYTVHTFEGVTITEDVEERKKLFELKVKCEHLERIAKRWREKYFARVERVTRWFRHESKKGYTD